MNDAVFEAVMRVEVESHRETLEGIGYDVEHDDLIDLYNMVVNYQQMTRD